MDVLGEETVRRPQGRLLPWAGVAVAAVRAGESRVQVAGAEGTGTG